jgi:chromosome segregation ATPase
MNANPSLEVAEMQARITSLENEVKARDQEIVARHRDLAESRK